MLLNTPRKHSIIVSKEKIGVYFMIVTGKIIEDLSKTLIVGIKSLNQKQLKELRLMQISLKIGLKKNNKILTHLGQC